MKRKSIVPSGIKRGGRADLKWRRTAQMIKDDVRDARNLTKVFEAAALIPVAKIIGYAAPPAHDAGAKQRAMTNMLNVAPSTSAPLNLFEELGCGFLLLGRGDSITAVHAVGARVADADDQSVLMLRAMHGKAFPLSAERVKGARLYVLASCLDGLQQRIAQQFASGLPKSWHATLPATDFAEVYRALTALDSD